MPETLSRFQVRLVAVAYGVMAVLSGLLIFKRYLLYVGHPQDVIAASGMYAGGDLLLEMMILCFFVVPSAMLIFFIRKLESAYTACAKLLLGLSVAAPLSLGLMFVPILNLGLLGNVTFFRLFAIPIFGSVLIFSLCLTRSSRARRFITYALLMEALPVGVAIGIFVLSSMRRHG